MAVITLTAQIQLTSDNPLDRERAQAFVEALFDASPNSTQVAADPAAAVYAEAGAATKGGRQELSPAELREVLTDLATGTIGAPLNSGERAMLRAIAQSAPEPFDYDENRELLGSGAKFGNVSSGLARRFWTRGYELPYEPVEYQGYRMDLDDAQVVLQVLDEAKA